jgi:sigma-B regulation protein RsbU (phosphoserine phosphatase)
MTIECHPQLVARLRWISRVSGVIAAAGGILVLVGWAGGVTLFKSVVPGWPSMQPITALAFVLAGVSLWRLRPENPDEISAAGRRLGRLAAALVVGIGAATLVEYLFHYDFGIDQLLFLDGDEAGQMPPGAAVDFILLGTAILMLNVEYRQRWRPAQILTIPAVLIALVGVLGYVYGAKSLTGVGPYTEMALHTTLGLMVLCAGVLSARPDRGVMAIFNSDSAGGTSARRLLPAAFLIPAALGGLRVLAHRRGFHEDVENGVAFLMVATMLLFAGLIWLNARWLYELERKRKQVEAELGKSAEAISDLYNNAPCGYHSLAPDGTYLRINDTELTWLGYTREELVGRKKFSDLMTPMSLLLFKINYPAFKERGFARDLEYELIRKDGTVLPVLLNATAVRDPNGDYVMSRSTLLDMTEQRRGNRRLAIEHSVTRILAEANTPAEATQKILQAVCENLEWDAAALWTLDRAAGLMRCLDFWHRPALEVRAFEESTRQRTYASGAGLPGQVWASGQPAWFHDLVPDANFPRAAMAQQAGLRGVFGFPIRLGTDILGVMEFFSGEIRQPDADLLRTFAAIGAQIGQFIERKQVETALAQERDLMNTLLDNIPDTIYFKDRQSRFMRINHAQVKKMKVKDVGEIIGKTDFDFFSSEHAQQAFGDEQRMIETGVPIVGIEEKETWQDGTVTWVSTTKECIRDKQGNIVGTFGISRDITERKQAEAALEQERFLLRALMDNLPDRIYFKDAQGRFLRNNRAHLKQFGVADAAQILGKSDFDFFTEAFAREAYADEQRVINTGLPLTKEEEILWPDGRVDWALVTKLPLRDADGKVVGTFGISRDITERKLAEKQLARYAAELRQKNEQVGEELKMARELQQALLPQQFPRFPARSTPAESAVQFHTFYHPSGNVSGDYYDVFPLSDTAVGIFICDVMGHDVRAALVTAMMRAFVQDLNPLAGDPGKLLTEINRGLAGILKQTGTIMYATAFFGVVDIEHGRLLFANAGHPNPVQVHGAAGQVDAVQCAGSLGPALGLFDDAIYQTFERTVAAGDLLLLFTDGLFEVEGQDQEQFSHEQLQATVLKHIRLAPAKLLTAVLTDVREFSADKEFTDDVCLVGAEVRRLIKSALP